VLRAVASNAVPGNTSNTSNSGNTGNASNAVRPGAGHGR
jgi:hypothetical protein